MCIQDIENQKAHIEYLKLEMQAGYAEKYPTRWEVNRGYVPTTCEYTDSIKLGTWTDGIDYVVLDDDHIAWRLNGDMRDVGDWTIDNVDVFVYVVVEDSTQWLALWQEQQEILDTTEIDDDC